jgi:hypothetical protein
MPKFRHFARSCDAATTFLLLTVETTSDDDSSAGKRSIYVGKTGMIERYENCLRSIEPIQEGLTREKAGGLSCLDLPPGRATRWSSLASVIPCGLGARGFLERLDRDPLVVDIEDLERFGRARRTQDHGVAGA